MKKIGQNGPPKLPNVQTPQKVQQSGGQVQQQGQSTQMPQSFEPSKTTLANQALPSVGTSQQAGGTIKAGLLSRSNIQVGNLLDGARQMMDKLDQQINWRMGRLTGQLSDLLKPSKPTEPPPIQAMYGVIMPGPGGIGGGPGQVKPPAAEPPPIAAMYGVIMPGPGGIGGDPGQVKPPATEPPPIAAMYGVIMPGPGGPGGSQNPPPIAAMYGVIMPGNGDWGAPVIQPKYGVIRPPMVQVKPDSAQQN